MYKIEMTKRDAWEFVNRNKHKMCISSVL